MKKQTRTDGLDPKAVSRALEDAEHNAEWSRDCEIRNLCRALADECSAIIRYTECMMDSCDENARKIYEDNRADELPHVQNLAVALTALLAGEEPTEAENMG